MTAESFYFYLSAKNNYKYHNHGQRVDCSSNGRGCWDKGGGAEAKKRTKKY